MIEAIAALEETLEEMKRILGTSSPASSTLLALHSRFVIDADAAKVKLRTQAINALYREEQEAAGHPEEYWKLISEFQIVSRIKALREQFPNIGLLEAKYIVTGNLNGF